MPDILPPGNTPAWSPVDAAGTIADTWQQEMWPALWPAMNHKYGTVAERNSDLAGLGPLDAGVLSFTRDTNTLWAFTGTIWVAIWSSGSAWTTVTPVWENGDAVVLAIGNGTHSQRYIKTGRTVTMSGKLVRGSTSNVGTSHYRFSLPVAAADFALVTGAAVVSQQSGAVETAATLRAISSTRAVLLIPSSTVGVSARLGSTATVGDSSWDTGDLISYTVTYESAS